MAVKTSGSSSGPTLPPPCPKSPPGYPDLYGKRRELARVQMLEREISFLEDELKSIDGLQPASRSCKEVADYVVANADPLVPTHRKIRRSFRFWKWLCWYIGAVDHLVSAAHGSPAVLSALIASKCLNVANADLAIAVQYHATAVHVSAANGHRGTAALGPKTSAAASKRFHADAKAIAAEEELVFVAEIAAFFQAIHARIALAADGHAPAPAPAQSVPALVQHVQRYTLVLIVQELVVT
ncbi:G-protein gamma-like domain, partial [Dillenia turbinata]